MASRYHWIRGSIGQPNFTGSTTFPVIDAVIPAGATMKKFIIRNNSFTGHASGASINFLNPASLFRTVDIISGPYSPRNLYQDFVSLGCEYVALEDSFTAPNNRIYTTILSCGDERLFVDQKCAYGKVGQPSFTVRLSCGLASTGLAPGNLLGTASYEFDVLYYL